LAFLGSNVKAALPGEMADHTDARPSSAGGNNASTTRKSSMFVQRNIGVVFMRANTKCATGCAHHCAGFGGGTVTMIDGFASLS
jgi:hypothetical protein